MMSMKLKSCSATVLIALAIVVAPAVAKPCQGWCGPISHATLMREATAAVQIARQTWPGACGPVRVVHSSAALNATGFAAYTDPENCILYLRDVDELRGWPFDLFCTVIVHEFGHLAGLGHSADPTNIMYAKQLVMFPACVASSERFQQHNR